MKLFAIGNGALNWPEKHCTRTHVVVFAGDEVVDDVVGVLDAPDHGLLRQLLLYLVHLVGIRAVALLQNRHLGNTTHDSRTHGEHTDCQELLHLPNKAKICVTQQHTIDAKSKQVNIAYQIPIIPRWCIMI